jgi:organic radical activating enzyme
MNNFKCAWVENMMSVETDGFTRPCCLETSENARISHISNGILNSFNSEKLILLKKNLENGFNEKTRNTCFRCEILEKNNQKSLRTETNFLSEVRELKFLQFKMSNKCQLTCAHCGPDRSSGWAKLLNITPHVKNSFELTDVFLNELIEILPQLEIIKFTGGEPFLDINHWKILEHLKKHNRSHCKLEYITNGISPFKPELWEGWKEIRCSISVDGFEETYEWFRRGSNWKKLLESIKELESFTKIQINYSITPYTIQDYHTSKKFWKYNFVANPIVYPDYSSLKKFPKDLVEVLEDYKNIPYFDFAQGTTKDLVYFKNWATTWDKKWNTPGWADKILYWF